MTRLQHEPDVPEAVLRQCEAAARSNPAPALSHEEVFAELRAHDAEQLRQEKKP